MISALLIIFCRDIDHFVGEDGGITVLFLRIPANFFFSFVPVSPLPAPFFHDSRFSGYCLVFLF